MRSTISLMPARENTILHYFSLRHAHRKPVPPSHVNLVVPVRPGKFFSDNIFFSFLQAIPVRKGPRGTPHRGHPPRQFNLTSGMWGGIENSLNEPLACVSFLSNGRRYKPSRDLTSVEPGVEHLRASVSANGGCALFLCSPFSFRIRLGP